MVWLRTRVRGIAAGVLCLLAFAGAVSVAHETSHHDAACFVATAHDAAAHAIGPGLGEAGHPLHCVLCHWTRAFRVRPTLITQYEDAAPRVVRTATPAVRLLAWFFEARPPLRAPPAPALAV